MATDLFRQLGDRLLFCVLHIDRIAWEIRHVDHARIFVGTMVWNQVPGVDRADWFLETTSRVWTVYLSYYDYTLGLLFQDVK